MYKPSYLQKTTAECGLACVGFVAAHFGKTYTINELRGFLSISARGTNLLEIIGLARKLDLQARALRVPLEDLARMPRPAILHWDGSHFVVLVDYKKGKLHIHDPALGDLRMSLAEASSRFTGVALELTPTETFTPKKDGPDVSWRQLVGRIHGLKRSLGQVLFLAAVLQLVMLVAPLFTQWTVDSAIVSGDLELLSVLLIGLTMCILIRASLETARGWLSIVASTQFSAQWSAKVVAHMLRLPAQWFEVRNTGDVVSRFQSMQSIQMAVTGRLVDIVLDGVFASVILVVMFFYSVKLALVVLAAIVLYAAIRILPHGHFHRANDEALIHEAKAQTHFLENLRAMQVIKLAGLETLRATQWTNMAIHAINRRATTQKMTQAFGTGYSLAFGIESVAVLGLGASMTINGALTVGMLMAFISYKDEFSSRVQRFIDNMMGIRMLQLHAERLSDIVLANAEDLNSGPIGEAPLDQAPTLEVENLSFRYGDNLPWVLRNVSLKVAATEHVAIVGPTGCGKTTLAKILLGLLEPTEGTVRMNGVSLQQMGLSAWRRNVAAVMQDDQLFSGSLRDNIAGFDEDVQHAQIEHAARLASIHLEIAAMPMGYHTLNGDMGSSLSGGQKQRVLLARALYRQPRILLLDEATSNLDVDKERSVNEAIRGLQATRITIAHRPETIASADRVIELAGSAGH